MTDQEHTPTDQETALYDAMTAGDWETVERMSDDALTALPPDPIPEDWVSPADQFSVDYAHAHAHYQADHEAPQDEREQATVEEVEVENTAADEVARG